MSRDLINIDATAPAHWACYFFNDDPEGLSDADIAAADAFIARIDAGAPAHMDEEEEHYFAHAHQVALICPEAPRLGCTLAMYYFLKEA
jgi:hypothetical protein